MANKMVFTRQPNIPSGYFNFRMVVLLSYSLVLIITFRDLANTIDEENVAKFTSIVKEFDSFSKLVHLTIIHCKLFKSST
jgi:lipopolysaccharide biosynthesis glycosyltransferase